MKLGEWALRVNYMASIAWSSFGLMFLLAYPFDQRLLSPWVVLASLPYFSTMSSDLKRNGYKRSDIFRIYGFNIALLTVNLSGTLKSIQQGMTNTKIPFARTPKVNNRTASPALYVTMPWVIIIYSCMVFYADTLSHNWGQRGVRRLQCDRDVLGVDRVYRHLAFRARHGGWSGPLVLRADQGASAGGGPQEGLLA